MQNPTFIDFCAVILDQLKIIAYVTRTTTHYKKYGTVISNCVDRCKLTYFLLCAQAYFHTNMPIICHKRPRKSTRVGWRVISLPWMDRDLQVSVIG